ncbi:MAG: VOC family protein [Sporomusaceae bacterium]|nr:VOC family protein [Sporomusaceae bacterium]
MKFHHAGIACGDIAAAADFVRRTQPVLSISPVVADAAQQAELCMIETAAGLSIELIAGPVVASYVKKGVYLYHLCWEVPDLLPAIEQLSREGARLISPPKPAPLFGGREVAFVYTPLGLMELLQEERHAL